MQDMTAERWTLRQWGLAFVASLVLLWPALINGGPFWFPDTPTYVRGADAASVYVTGQRSEWSDRIVVREISASEGEMPATSEGGSKASGSETITLTRPVLVGRSIYYGAMIFVFLATGGPWLAVLAQCLLVGILTTYAIWRAARLTSSRHCNKAFLVVPVLSLISPLAYFACMFMPDVFAGLGMLTLAVTLAFWPRLSPTDRVIFAGSSAIFATFHTTHILIFAVLTMAALLRLLLLRKSFYGPLLAGSAVVVAGIVSNILFAEAVRRTTMVEPESPPFLTARLQANGLGMNYMEANCDQGDRNFAVCQYRERLPVPSDAFLWVRNSEEGVVQILPESERRILAAEDKRFFFAVALYDPVRFVSVALASTAQQLTDFELDVFNYAHRAPTEIKTVYPVAVAEHILSTRAAQDTMPTRVIVIASIISAFLAALSLIWFLFAALRSRKGGSDLVALTGLILIGIFANAMICGALSGSKPRYQMRLIWTLPLTALVIGAASTPSVRRTPSVTGRQQTKRYS